jgi:hypothetical protein
MPQDRRGKRKAQSSLLLAGCSGVTGPALPVEWRTEPLLEALSRPARVEAEGGTGSIMVRGDTDLRGCHTLERSAVRRGSTITFRVEHRRTGDRTCLGEAVFVRYEAVIRGVEAGTYTLQVEYTSDVRSPENPVLEQSVRVQ